jgi:flagellar biosynthesis protein
MMDYNNPTLLQDNEDKPEIKRAVALAYDPEKDSAPRVLASGRGLVAQKILEIARANDLPIRDDPILTEALAQVDLNQAVPPELYAVVAEVFAFVYRVRKKKYLV